MPEGKAGPWSFSQGPLVPASSSLPKWFPLRGVLGADSQSMSGGPVSPPSLPPQSRGLGVLGPARAGHGEGRRPADLGSAPQGSPGLCVPACSPRGCHKSHVALGAWVRAWLFHDVQTLTFMGQQSPWPHVAACATQGLPWPGEPVCCGRFNCRHFLFIFTFFKCFHGKLP